MEAICLQDEALKALIDKVVAYAKTEHGIKKKNGYRASLYIEFSAARWVNSNPDGGGFLRWPSGIIPHCFDLPLYTLPSPGIEGYGC